MLLMIAISLWVLAAAWFAAAWTFFRARDRRRARVREALYDLALDGA